MAGNQKNSEQLLVLIQSETAFIKVRARGSFKVSSALKEFGIQAIDQGVTTFVMDMADCIGMDSTFMGVVAGLAFRLKKKNNGLVLMVQLSPRTQGLLSTLGLDKLVQPYMAGSTPSQYESILAHGEALEQLPATEQSRRDTAEMMLNAHETLVEVSPSNLPKFKDVLTFLREDLKKAEEDTSD